ncbi:cation:proton antiporter [archaeon]|jgi:Kef-type K+ transport system membrane component KefB|nr:cation:proton antiporter [archaeon]MBT4022286.1 cation:proton antiporter [archaeon]MBT4271757.1 cation:proton antiporter [archaeon]MBT4461401.1 cation:proton antiporter [archaeon]MBT4858657.1 cation:proton antiporter [archaeon]
MPLVDNTLFVLAIVLFFGLVVPEFFKKFQLPFATSLVILGSILGKNGFNYIEINASIELFGFLGAAFLMLMAGLEAKTEHLTNLKEKIISMSVLNSVLPFITGFFIAYFFGYSFKSSLFIGIVFISSSAALVFSTLKTIKYDRTNIGKAIINIVVLEDIVSLLMLSVLIQGVTSTRFHLLIYFGLLVSSVIILRMFLPEITTYFFRKHRKKDEYETHLRIVIALLLFVLILYSALGINPIVASFLVGFILAKVPNFHIIKEKLHVIGYGIFVPIFFFIVGTQTDFRILTKFDIKNFLMISIILGLFLSKFISGFISAKVQGFKLYDSLIFGTISTSKLTTTLSVSFAAFSLNIIDNALLSSIVMLTVISTIAGPGLTTLIAKKAKGEKHV